MDFYLSQCNMNFYLPSASLSWPAGYTRPNFSSFSPVTMWDPHQAKALLNLSFSLIVMVPIFPLVSPFLLHHFSLIYVKVSEIYYIQQYSRPSQNLGSCYTVFPVFSNSLSDIRYHRTDPQALWIRFPFCSQIQQSSPQKPGRLQGARISVFTNYHHYIAIYYKNLFSCVVFFWFNDTPYSK